MKKPRTINLDRKEVVDALLLYLREIRGVRSLETLSFVHDPDTGRVTGVQITTEDPA